MSNSYAKMYKIYSRFGPVGTSHDYEEVGDSLVAI